MFGIGIFFGGAGIDHDCVGQLGRLTAVRRDVGHGGGERHKARVGMI